MSIRKRTWTNSKGDHEAWVVDFADANGKRRLKTFATKAAAEKFQTVARAVASGIAPEPMARGHHSMDFVAELPSGGWRKGTGRDAVAEAFRLRFGSHEPSKDVIVLQLTAEMPPSQTVADVDNLLKPVLDALSGVAWINDTQVAEMTVRRVVGYKRKLKVRIWQIPQQSVTAYRLAVETGNGENREGPRL